MVMEDILKVAYKLRDPDKLSVGNVFTVFSRPSCMVWPIADSLRDWTILFLAARGVTNDDAHSHTPHKRSNHGWGSVHEWSGEVL